MNTSDNIIEPKEAFHYKPPDKEIKEKDDRQWNLLWQFSLAPNEMRTIERARNFQKNADLLLPLLGRG